MLHCFLSVNLHGSQNRVNSISPSHPCNQQRSLDGTADVRLANTFKNLLLSTLTRAHYTLSFAFYLLFYFLLSWLYNRSYINILLFRFLHVNQIQASEWQICHKWQKKWDTNFENLVPHWSLKSTILLNLSVSMDINKILY